MTITKQNEKRMHKYEEIGKVFHDFRVNRNISLKQIADENVSISQISRFERGESDLSVSKFLIALENMKVETGEFMDALQKNHDSESTRIIGSVPGLPFAMSCLHSSTQSNAVRDQPSAPTFAANSGVTGPPPKI